VKEAVNMLVELGLAEQRHRAVLEVLNDGAAVASPEVFVALAEGWSAPSDTPPTAEAIEAHLAEVAATEPFIAAGSIFDDESQICLRIGIPYKWDKCVPYAPVGMPYWCRAVRRA
jgi:hypothetical protein